jgi:tetratricopeptide (TPR) repeat protein
MSLPADFFIAGGTLRAHAPSYVTRPADQELLEHTLAGEFCYVLTPRQMGKSSLMIRTARRLAEAGRTVAILDLTGIGSGSADQWYQGLLEQIARDLRLNIDVPNWWQARASLAIPQRFSEFLRDVVLQEIASPIVIFIDEIDSTLNLDFRDDFFAAIRAIYNARATESAYQRLTFALLGVATPTDLIHDRERTPFNIGRRIVLQEFSYDEARSLKAGLDACHPGQGDAILHHIFNWTNGYPYLTQKLCLAAAEQPAAHWDATQVDELVEATFFSDTGRKDPNFKFVQQRIQESSVAERRQMLNLYRKVYNGNSVPDDDRSQSQNYLELYGLVRVERGKLHVRNDIYRRIFDQKWIEANTPANRDLRWAIGASVIALLAIVAVWIIIRQTPSPNTSLYVKQFNDNAFPTARIEALAGLFNVQDGLYDRDDEQGLSLFYNLGPYDQLDLFSQANARAKGREMATAIRRISLTLDEQDANDLAIMGEMITALGMAGQPGTDALVKELTNWKNGRELAEQGRYQAATSAYNATLLLNPNNLAARYDKASTLIKLARYSEALEDLNQIIVIAKTAAPPPTAVPTATFTPTAVLAVTGAPLASPAAGIPTRPPFPVTVVPTIAATSVITTTLQASASISRFINTELIIKSVVDTIRGDEGLLSYLQDPQNQTIANQDLVATLGLSSVAQESTPLPPIAAATVSAQSTSTGPSPSTTPDDQPGTAADEAQTVTAVSALTAFAAEAQTSIAQTEPPSPTETSLPSPTKTPPPSPTKAPPPTDTPRPVCAYQGQTDNATMIQMIEAEATAALTKNMWIIQNIFADDAVITDVTNNKTWTNPTVRYTELFNTVDFFSLENLFIQPVDVTDTTAHFTGGSKGTYQFVGGYAGEFTRPAGSNHWMFQKKENGCWMITAFSFN